MEMKLDINVFMKGATVDIDSDELKKIFDEKFNDLSLNEALSLLKIKYLESRGISESDSIPGERVGFRWESYQNNGSHYSGYYAIKVITTLEDIEVMNAISTLRTLFL